MHKRKNIYHKICCILSMKKIAIVSILLFVVIVIPILYLSFYNRASGDDFGYGVWGRRAWIQTHSLRAVFAAAAEAVKSVYQGWQGTWLSVFLFALQPEVFSEKAYVITTFLSLTVLMGSITWALYEVLCRRLYFSKWNYVAIVSLICLSSILFVKSPKSALYWYNGIIHYTVPFALCLMCTVLLFRYIEKVRLWQYIGVCIIMILLGGSNYQAALFTLITAFYAGIWGIIVKKEKRVLWLLLPVVGEIAGLLVSMKAPGNKVRGGEEFGFSVMHGVKAIGASFINGILDMKDYLIEKPLLLIFLLLIFCFMLEAWTNMEEIPAWKNTGMVLLAIFCLYSAMQTPAIYADVNVSGGVFNMNFWVFLLMMFAILLAGSKKIAMLLRKKGKNVDWIHSGITIPMIVLCGVLMIVCKGSIKETTWYICVDYLRSGQAEDFKEQMELQTRILTDESIQDAVVPFINDEQGPLMHMPVTADPEAWSNTVTADFYGKNSVMAIPREEWEQKYGEQWLN